MDVKRKVQLMRVYESYWDMLPPELHAYIIELKIAQLYIDEERKEMMQRLGEEIKMYARLKEKWAVGHVKCIPCRTPCLSCGRYHVSVYGYHVSKPHNVTFSYFLSIGMINALSMIDVVKANYF